jgi:hypothetical protein
MAGCRQHGLCRRVISSFNYSALLQSTLGNVSTPQSWEWGTMAAVVHGGTTAAAMVHCEFTSRCEFYIHTVPKILPRGKTGTQYKIEFEKKNKREVSFVLIVETPYESMEEINIAIIEFLLIFCKKGLLIS